MPQARRSVSDGRSPKRLDQLGRSGRVLRSRSASRHGAQIPQMTAADAQYLTNGGSWRDVVVATLIIVGWLPARRQRLLGEALTSAEGQVLPFATVPFWTGPCLQLPAPAGSGQSFQLHRASPMTRSRSWPFSHGSSSVNKVTHCRHEHGIRVMSVPQNIRSGPNASKQRCRCGCRLRNG